MSRGVLVDHMGFAGEALVLAGGQENKTVSVEKGTNRFGDTEKTETYAAVMDPSIDYSVIGDFGLAALTLGLLVGSYFITGFSVTTAAGAQPKITVTGAEKPDGDVQGRTFAPPAATVSKDWAAQFLFSAFTLTGDGCHLKSCSAKAACTFARGEDGVAEPNCSNVSGASLEITLEIEQLGATGPVFTVAEGWTESSPLTATEDTKTYRKFSATLTKSVWLAVS